MTGAERQRRLRQRRGAGDKPGRPVTAQCPSASAYKRHVRNGEDGRGCGCHAAYLAQQAGYYRARVAKTRKSPRSG